MNNLIQILIFAVAALSLVSFIAVFVKQGFSKMAIGLIILSTILFIMAFSISNILGIDPSYP